MTQHYRQNLAQFIRGEEISTPAEAVVFVRTLVQELGAGFHPDTPFDDYLDLNTGELVFNPAEVVVLEVRLEEARALVDVEEIAAPLVQAAAGAGGASGLECDAGMSDWQEREDHLSALEEAELVQIGRDESRSEEERAHAGAILMRRRGI
jgi:hypothetical protein